jgi:hypothetical protein
MLRQLGLRGQDSLVHAVESNRTLGEIYGIGLSAGAIRQGIKLTVNGLIRPIGAVGKHSGFYRALYDLLGAERWTTELAATGLGFGLADGAQNTIKQLPQTGPDIQAAASNFGEGFLRGSISAMAGEGALMAGAKALSPWLNKLGPTKPVIPYVTGDSIADINQMLPDATFKSLSQESLKQLETLGWTNKQIEKIISTVDDFKSGPRKIEVYTFNNGDKGFKVIQFNTHDVRTGSPILKKSPSYAIYVRQVDADGNIKLGYGVTHDAKNKLLFRITNPETHQKVRPRGVTRKMKKDFYYSGEQYEKFFDDLNAIERTPKR